MLEVPEAEFVETRLVLLATIATRFSTKLSENPIVAHELEVATAKMTQGISLAQMTEAISEHFKTVNLSEVRLEFTLKETALVVLTEFVQKTGQNPTKLTSLIQSILK